MANLESQNDCKDMPLINTDENKMTITEQAASKNTECIDPADDGGEKLLNVNGSKDGKSRNKNSTSSSSLNNALTPSRQQRGSVIEQGVKGKVKWYNLKSRYGFIVRDDVDENYDRPRDVFVHQSAISKSHQSDPCRRTLCIGEPVLFDIVEGKNGPEAYNVTGPDGSNVKGCPHITLLNIVTRRFHRMHSERKNEKDELARKLEKNMPRYGRSPGLQKKNNEKITPVREDVPFYETKERQRRTSRRRVPRGNGDGNDEEKRRLRKPRIQRRRSDYGKVVNRNTTLNSHDDNNQEEKLAKTEAANVIKKIDDHINNAVKSLKNANKIEEKVDQRAEERLIGVNTSANVVASLEEENDVISAVERLAINSNHD